MSSVCTINSSVCIFFFSLSHPSISISVWAFSFLFFCFATLLLLYVDFFIQNLGRELKDGCWVIM